MKKLLNLINFVCNSHTTRPLLPKKAFRKWDGKTPYAIHPLWCAMTLLTETNLPETIRVIGADALLLHDILEETLNFLPYDIDQRVERLVKGMTFDSFQQEVERFNEMSNEVKLLKLYDKVSNLLDGSWMTEEKRKQYIGFIQRLAAHVTEVYGTNLNILKIAQAIT